MKDRASIFILKSTLAVFLCMGIAVIHVSGQKKPESKFNFKDNFVSSGGLFFAQPLKSPVENNYAGISFSPQLNLLNSFSDFTIALGTQMDLGYRISEDNSNRSKLMASIPAMVTFNAGHLASKDFNSPLGIFVGAGLEFGFLNGESREGIMWTAGLRTWFLKKSFTLRYSQLIYDEHMTMRVFSLQMNLGEYLKQVYMNNQLSRFVNPMQ